MVSSWIPTLVLIGCIAVISPILVEMTRSPGIPGVVFELGLGIIVGPDVLKLAHTSGVVNGFSDMGLAFLMFLAGFELDLLRIRGRPLRLASLGWVASAGLAVAIALAVVSTGLVHDPVALGLSLTTTALGTLLPVLRDASVFDTEFGRYVMAVGTVGEFGPIVAVAVFLTQRDPLITIALLFFFVATAVGAALLATRTQQPRVVAILRRNLHSSAQLPVRVSVLLILLLVYLAFELGLDVLLGAFAAGIVVSLFSAGEDSVVIREKLEAIGFGFLVPIFFVVSGMQFDLHSLIHKPSALLQIPLFLLLFLVIRGLPALYVYRKYLPKGQLIPLALFSATGLPLIVVIADIGVSAHRMAPENAAALIAVGILSVLIFPVTGLRGLQRYAAKAEAGGSTGTAPSEPHTPAHPDEVPPPALGPSGISPE